MKISEAFLQIKSNDIIMQNRVFLWTALVTGLILSIPLILKFPWTRSDFIVMGTLLFGAGSIFILLARVLPSKYRALVGGTILLLVFWLWVELAVGLFTNWGS